MSQVVVAIASVGTAGLTTCGPRQRRVKAETKDKGSSSSNLGFGRERKEPSWRCAQGCGACCKLDKGSSFATPEEIFEDPTDIRLYRSLIEPDIFQALYGIDKKRFNKEACSFCQDTIKAIYGSHSKELDNFNRTIRNPSST